MLQSSFCAVSHRLSAHRQRAHLHLQLAVRPPQRRRHDPAHRRHRRRAQYRSLAQFHLRRTALARSRLGRRVPAIRAPGAAPASWPKRSFKRAWRIAISRPRKPPRARNRARRAPGSSTPACANCRARKATAAPPPANPSRCASACRATACSTCASPTRVYGEQAKSTADIEDFALLRSDGMPTYHLASCADDADLAHQPHHPRPGPPHQHLQARADLRSRRRRAAAIRAPAAADRARRHQALQAPARPGGQRHHLSRRRFSAARVRQFPRACWAGRPRTIASR